MKPEEIRCLYDRKYATTYDDKFLHSHFFSADTQYELEYLRSVLTPGMSWLDVACGTGYFLRHFPEIARTGLDLSPGMLEQARVGNAGVDFVQHDYRDPIPKWTDRFDLVSCMWYAYGYVESMRELSQLIANMASWTAPSGCCFVPLADPDLLARQTIPFHPEMAQPGEMFITGITWSYIESEKAVHAHMLAPKLQIMAEQFSLFFEEIEIIRYPQGLPGTGRRPALLARRKKTVAPGR
jgi:SAM-dependent methyltransferase